MNRYMNRSWMSFEKGNTTWKRLNEWHTNPQSIPQQQFTRLPIYSKPGEQPLNTFKGMNYF
ncbi:MAG: hypothetical protein ACKVGW_05305, partial [Verrucomicrobiia bacterium]